MINILHLIHKYRGDYPLLNQQVNLDPSRFRTVVCYLSGEDDGRNNLSAAGIKTLYLGFKPKSLRLHNLPLLFQIRAVIENENIQIINCQQHRTTPLGVVASVISRNKPAVISTLHGLGTAKTFRRKLLNWFLYRRMNRIIGISQGVSADILASNWQLSSEKLAIVQNGLNYERFLVPMTQMEARRKLGTEIPKGFWFGTVGRLSAVKNHSAMIRAFQLVANEAPNCFLLIAGDGELRDELEALSASLGISRQVHFLGLRRDIPTVMKSLDVFLLPSLREGLPLALLEAMASGLPVIASGVGGIPEVVDGEEFALLTDPHDEHNMAESMLEMANLSSHELQILGEAARRRALSTFSAERMIAGYERIYVEAYEDWLRRHPGTSK